MSNIDVSIKLSGLLPFEKYDYAFQGLGGNWPCIITPASGTIRPYGDSLNLDAVVHFCTTTSSCPSGSSGYLTYATGLCDPNPNLYTTIRLSLKPETLPHTLYSDIKTISCNNCFSQPVITTPQSVTLTKAQGNEYVMTTSVIGLQPNQTYTYSISSLDANWPIMISPSSGTIKVPKDRTTLTNHLMFCKSTGLCPEGNGVADYTVNAACLAEANLFGILQLELSNNDCALGSVFSNPIPVYCKDCLPSVDIKLYNSNRKTISSLENINGFLLEPTLSGLKPDQQHTYQFKSLDANWPVFLNPVSGTINSPTSNGTISTELFFCSSTGICPSGTKGVLNYSLNNVVSTKLNNNYFVNLQMELTDTSCSETHKSNTLLVYCEDCVSKPDVRIISSRVT